MYYKRLRDYLDYKPGAKLVLNQNVETEVMNTKGKAYGVEVMIKKPDIITDEKGSSSFSFYTSDIKGQYVGVLQGLDGEGHPASTTFTFSVR